MVYFKNKISYIVPNTDIVDFEIKLLRCKNIFIIFCLTNKQYCKLKMIFLTIHFSRNTYQIQNRSNVLLSFRIKTIKPFGVFYKNNKMFIRRRILYETLISYSFLCFTFFNRTGSCRSRGQLVTKERLISIYIFKMSVF